MKQSKKHIKYLDSKKSISKGMVSFYCCVNKFVSLVSVSFFKTFSPSFFSTNILFACVRLLIPCLRLLIPCMAPVESLLPACTSKVANQYLTCLNIFVFEIIIIFNSPFWKFIERRLSVPWFTGLSPPRCVSISNDTTVFVLI